MENKDKEYLKKIKELTDPFGKCPPNDVIVSNIKEQFFKVETAICDLEKSNENLRKFYTKEMLDIENNTGDRWVLYKDGYGYLFCNMDYRMTAYICVPLGHPFIEVSKGGITEHPFDCYEGVNCGITWAEGNVFGWDYQHINNDYNISQHMYNAYNFAKMNHFSINQNCKYHPSKVYLVNSSYLAEVSKEELCDIIHATFHQDRLQEERRFGQRLFDQFSQVENIQTDVSKEEVVNKLYMKDRTKLKVTIQRAQIKIENDENEDAKK